MNREIMEVHELFSKKFPIYVELEKQNKLMESSYNEYIQMYKEKYGDDNKYMNLTKTMAKLNSDEMMPIDYMDNTELVKTMLEEHDVKHKVVYNDVDDELINIEFDEQVYYLYNNNKSNNLFFFWSSIYVNIFNDVTEYFIFTTIAQFGVHVIYNKLYGVNRFFNFSEFY